MSGRNLLVRLGLLLAIALAGAAGWRWWTSPDRQIHRIVDAVAVSLTHEEAVGALDALAAAASLHEHLTPEVVVHTGRGTPIVGRQEVVSLAARLRASTPFMRVHFFDVEIAYRSASSALVSATVDVRTRTESGEEVADAQRIEADVIEREGRWQVMSVRAVSRQERAT